VRVWHAELTVRRSGAAAPAYRLLRAIFNTAVEDEVILRNPCKIKGAEQIDPLNGGPPTVDEVRELLRATPSHLQAAIVIACAVPSRRNEVELSS
jgi:hypothetical protein